jgi:arabinofuranosyltransferase
LVYVVVGAWLALTVFVVLAWPRINTERAWRLGALLLALAFSLAHQLLFATVAEDAFITFRYAENIAEGNGAVFNAGERVEGYSNFLWMMLIAMPKALFGLDIVHSAAVLGTLCSLGCVPMAYLLVNRIVARVSTDGDQAPRPALGVAAAVLTAGASGLAAYGPSGLETPLFVLLMLATVYALAARRPVVAGVVVALATMTRPDGVVIAAVAGLWLVLAAMRTRFSWWAPVGFLLGSLVFVVPWTTWRMTYYGHFLPNAVAAKSGGSIGWQLGQGWNYLVGFSLVQQGFLVLAIAALGACLRRPGKPTEPGELEARSLLWLLFWISGAYLAFITFAGGDWMPAWRLLTPLPPLIAVAAVATYGVLTAAAVPSPRPRDPIGRRFVPVVAAGLAVLSLVASIVNPRMLPAMKSWDVKIAEAAEIGAWIGERLPPGTVVSTYANGSLSYYAGTQLMVVDVLGLTDEHIARHGRRTEGAGPVGHIANDYDYVVNVRRPALAVTTGNGYHEEQHCGLDPAYGGRYSVATFRREGTAHWVEVYPRSDQAATVLAQLSADPRFVYVPCPS